MIGTIDVAVEAKSPNLPLFPMRAFVGSPSSIRVRNVPKRVGDWNINRVYVSVIYPDGATKQADCVQTGGVWVGTIEGSAAAGTCMQGYTVYADGTDENGNAVTGYILGKGDVAILQANGTPEPEPATVFVKLQEDGTDAEDGDLYPTENGYAIQQDGEAHLLGTPFDQISAYVESAVSAKADLSAVPTNVSQLSNDSGYVTSAQVVPSQVNTGNASASDKSLVSQALAEDAADEHSTRVVVDEYGNAILQKYTTGWYVSKIEEGTGSPVVYTETDAYYAFVSNVRVEPSEGRLYYTATCQDKQRNLPSKSREDFAASSASECTAYVSWTAAQAGGQPISLHLTVTNAETPVWVNIARLVPDSSKYSGLLDTQITPNGRFLTPAQVKPYSGILGYANRAQGSLFMFGRSDVLTPDENHFVTIDFNVGKLCYVGQEYYPWELSMYGGTTFDPSIQLSYKYWTTVSYKVNGRIRNMPLNDYAWLGIRTVDTRNTRPCYILAVENEYGYMVPDNNFHDGSGTSYPITFSTNNLSIETIDGVEGRITCTRQGTGTHTTELKYFAYETDLSAKADLSAVPTKTSELSNDSGFIEQNGTAVINSLTCDQLVANQAHIAGYATESDLSAKRDLTDMKVKGVPENDNSASWFTIKYGTTTENAWYYGEGRWETGQTLRVLAVPSSIYTLQKIIQEQWTDVGEFTLDSNAEAAITYEGVTYSITGYIGDLVVSNQLPEVPRYVPFTIKQDRTLYQSSQTITVKTSPTKTLAVATNPNGNGGTFVANFITSGWSDNAALSDVVTAPDTAGCLVFKISGQSSDTWGNLKSTLVSDVESFDIAFPL